MSRHVPIVRDLLSIIESRPPVVSGEGVMIYGVGSVLVLIGIANLVSWYRARRDWRDR